MYGRMEIVGLSCSLNKEKDGKKWKEKGKIETRLKMRFFVQNRLALVV